MADRGPAPYAFYTGQAPGSGSEVWFSGYEAFALLIGLLLQHRWPQGTVVQIMRRARPMLEQEHARILAQDPDALFDQTELATRAAPGMIVDNTDPVFLAIVSAGRGEEDRAELAPHAVNICRGHAELMTFMKERASVGLTSMTSLGMTKPQGPAGGRQLWVSTSVGEAFNAEQGSSMADKTSFSPDEWVRVVASPMIAGMAITAADPSGLWGLLREGMAGGWALLGAKQDTSANPLVKAAVEDFTTAQTRDAVHDRVQAQFKGSAAADLKGKAIEELRQVAAILDRSAGADGAPYKAWLREMAQKTAEAGTEGGFLGFGGVAVSDKEKATLAEVATALGAPAVFA